MNKRKILSLAMALSMIAILAVGATLAYFTDAEKATNTFTLGGVDIDLVEKKYENGAWVEFVGPDASENPVTNLGRLEPGVVKSFNKGVFTINNEDAAYVRNYVAVESTANDPAVDNVYTIAFNDAGMADPSEAPGKYRHAAVKTTWFENVNIDGTLYDIYVFDTEDGAALAEGDSFMTLTTVYLKATATNEDVEELENQLEVYTFSEAIQAAGLTHADAMKALIGDHGTLEAHATALITGMIK